MLILHPSSRCDVCLDAYTWQTIAQTPHAIPCGHVFCRPCVCLGLHSDDIRKIHRYECRCLFALSPYICPLCRKKFEPNKAKKLHVDRPENVDDNRENDLLQSLAISWEAPEDQLRALTFEVDTWLDTRADDTCIALRKARAALIRHLELKATGSTLECALTDIHARYKDMAIAYEAEHRQAVATETKLKNEKLKAEVKELRSATEQHKKNPLPRPPVPISTEYVPTFSQVIAHERVRFDLPSSPTTSPHAQSFEEESRRNRHKGKARSADYRLISADNQIPHPLPSQLSRMDLSEESPALISHFSHHSPCRTSTPAPSSGLQLHFENTNQPLDAYELAHTYLREYSQGLLDGKLIAEKAAASRSSTFQQPHAGTICNRTDSSLSGNDESIESRSMRSTRSAQSREIPHVSGPSVVDTSSRPVYPRQNTISSVATSAESSTGPNRSRSRSRAGMNQISHPSLVALLSDDVPSVSSRRSMTSLHSSPNPSIPSLSLPSLTQQPEPPTQPNLARAESPATSHLSKASSWGTLISTSTNHTTYSLLGLRDFREGSYPHMVNTDGVSTWSSPTRRVSSMVGVVPAHETDGGSEPVSPWHRGRVDNRINPQRLSQYPPPPPSLTSWHGSVASLSPVPNELSSSNAYHSDDEDENIVRQDELLSPNYGRRMIESQRMTRGRNQPLPAASPSFLLGESIIAEEQDESLDENLMEIFGNALGLELRTSPIPISAPTPLASHQPFLRSFSE